MADTTNKRTLESDGLWIKYYADTKVMIAEVDEMVTLRRKLHVVENLLEYYKEAYLDNEPHVVLLKGKTLGPKEKFEYFQTSKADPVVICRMFIKDTKTTNVHTSFFTLRNIDYYADIITPKKLEKCLERIKKTEFEVKDFVVLAIRYFYQNSAKETETDVRALVHQFLCSAVQDDDHNADKYTVLGGVEIKLKDIHHSAKPDHIIKSESTESYVLICEDEADDLRHAILHLFDQLITYSLSEAGSTKKYFCGIATTLARWRFCCYIRPAEGNYTANNFIVSDTFGIELENQLPTESFIKK